MSTYLKGIFITSFSAMSFGLNPLFVNYLQSNNINLLWTLIIRFGGSFLLFILIVKSKQLNFKLDTSIREVIIIFFCAVFFLLTSVFLVYSYTRIPSGLTTVLHFSYPILITLLSIKAKRDNFSIALAISIVFSILGVYFVTNPKNMEFDLLGMTSAFLSSITFSLYLFLLNDKKVKQIDNNLFVLYLNFFSIILLLLSSIFLLDDFVAIKHIDINLITFYGVFGYIMASAFGAFCFSFGTRIVGGPIAGTIGAFEPLTAVLVGVLYLNEVCSNSYMFGVGLILISTVIVSLFNSKSKKITSKIRI